MIKSKQKLKRQNAEQNKKEAQQPQIAIPQQQQEQQQKFESLSQSNLSTPAQKPTTNFQQQIQSPEQQQQPSQIAQGTQLQQPNLQPTNGHSLQQDQSQIIPQPTPQQLQHPSKRLQHTQQNPVNFTTQPRNIYQDSQHNLHQLQQQQQHGITQPCLLYTSPSPRDLSTSRMPSSA